MAGNPPVRIFSKTIYVIVIVFSLIIIRLVDTAEIHRYYCNDLDYVEVQHISRKSRYLKRLNEVNYSGSESYELFSIASCFELLESLHRNEIREIPDVSELP
jgi:hypothetical protein